MQRARRAWGGVAGLHARRPFLVSWLLLAAGMVLVVLLFGRDVGLTATQHATLALLCLPLAALCTWIVSLELEGGDRPTPGDG